MLLCISDRRCEEEETAGHSQADVYLHQHLLVLWVLAVVRFPTQLLHLGHQAPVAHDLQQAGLQRDAQSGDTQNTGGVPTGI